MLGATTFMSESRHLNAVFAGSRLRLITYRVKRCSKLVTSEKWILKTTETKNSPYGKVSGHKKKKEVKWSTELVLKMVLWKH